MSSDFKGFGYRVRFLRKEQKLTTKRLSELCDISEVYLRQIEGQGKIPSLGTFVEICNALKSDPMYLLQGLIDFPLDDETDKLLLQCKNLSMAECKKASDLLNLVFGNKKDEISE